MRTNLSLFHVKYGNLQQAVQGVNLTPPQPLITQAITNAGKADATGFELETTLAPVAGLTFTGNLGYTDFKFKELSPILTAGNDEYNPVFRAKWTSNVSAQYVAPLADDAQVTVRLDGNWRSRQYGYGGVPVLSSTFTAAERDAFKEAGKIDAYWIVNARLAIDDFALGAARGGFALWSKNLLNNKSPQFTQALSSLLISASFERARTYGIDFSIEF